MTGRWFSPGTLVSSTNKAIHYDVTEILLKVALNTINPNPVDGRKDNPMAKGTKRQSMAIVAIYMKLQIDQHELHYNIEVNRLLRKDNQFQLHWCHP